MMHGACSLAYLVERSPVLLEELLARVFVCVAAGDQEVEMGGVGPYAHRACADGTSGRSHRR